MLVYSHRTKIILRMLSDESVAGMKRKDTEVQKATCMELFVNETFFVVVVVLLVVFAVFTK